MTNVAVCELTKRYNRVTNLECLKFVVQHNKSEGAILSRYQLSGNVRDVVKGMYLAVEDFDQLRFEKLRNGLAEMVGPALRYRTEPNERYGLHYEKVRDYYALVANAIRAI